MKYLASAAFSIGILALPLSASAAIVCNDEGDCWRVTEKYEYPPDVKLQIYEDELDHRHQKVQVARAR